jgi:hypothetical protein
MARWRIGANSWNCTVRPLYSRRLRFSMDWPDAANSTCRAKFFVFTGAQPFDILRMSAGLGAMTGLLILGPARMKDLALGLTSLFTDSPTRLKAMSRIDSLKEAKRGIGVSCQCGRSARITARGRTVCYECFDADMGYLLDPVRYANQRMRERVREFDRVRHASIRMLD